MNTLQLLPPPTDLSDAELLQIAATLSTPLIRRYLQALLWNQIVDYANMQVARTAEEQLEQLALGPAIKGGISMLNTLLSISTATPTQTQGRE